MNDIDFFYLGDLFDTAHPHHEHVVFALVVCGIFAAGFIFLQGRLRDRT